MPTQEIPGNTFGFKDYHSSSTDSLMAFDLYRGEIAAADTTIDDIPELTLRNRFTAVRNYLCMFINGPGGATATVTIHQLIPQHDIWVRTSDPITLANATLVRIDNLLSATAKVQVTATSGGPVDLYVARPNNYVDLPPAEDRMITRRTPDP